MVWCSLMEEIFDCEYFSELRTKMLSACIDHTEFSHVCIDATVRCAMCVKGQQNYRKSKYVRNAAFFPDGAALRRVLTLRGRTGAVGFIKLIQDEKAENIADSCIANMPVNARQQVVAVACDQTSRALYLQLLVVFPGMRILYLDPVHLCIVYNNCHYKKMTSGQVYLREIMNKLNKVDPAHLPTFLGPVHDGVAEPPFSHAETFMHTHIEFGTMPVTQAESIRRELSPNSPFRTRLEFISALASLTSLFWSEVKRKSHVKSSTLARVISNAAAPDRAEWYLNGSRYRHELQSSVLSLLGSGTSSNETLHREINNWCSNQPEVHRTTLEMQLHVNSFSKLMTHNTALYSPGLRQMSQQEVLSALSAKWAFPTAVWDSMCKDLLSTDEHTISAACLPRLRERQWTAKGLKHRRITCKRPAAACIIKRPARKGVLKRHAFNLCRIKTFHSKKVVKHFVKSCGV